MCDPCLVYNPSDLEPGWGPEKNCDDQGSMNDPCLLLRYFGMDEIYWFGVWFGEMSGIDELSRSDEIFWIRENSWFEEISWFSGMPWIDEISCVEEISWSDVTLWIRISWFGKIFGISESSRFEEISEFGEMPWIDEMSGVEEGSFSWKRSWYDVIFWFETPWLDELFWYKWNLKKYELSSELGELNLNKFNIQNVSKGSDWITGLKWMKRERSGVPLTSYPVFH